MDSRGKAWAVGAGAALACLVLGWAIGTWTACGEGCRYDAETFGALGTWVGGLATCGALIYAARSFTAETRARQAELDKQEAERSRLERQHRKDANKVTLRVKPQFRALQPGEDCRAIRELHVMLYNRSAVTVTQASVDIKGREAVFEEVAPGKKFPATERLSVSDFQRSRPEDDGREEHALSSEATVWFTMHGKDWKRVGGGPVHLLDDAQGGA